MYSPLLTPSLNSHELAASLHLFKTHSPPGQAFALSVWWVRYYRQMKRTMYPLQKTSCGAPSLKVQQHLVKTGSLTLFYVFSRRFLVTPYLSFSSYAFKRYMCFRPGHQVRLCPYPNMARINFAPTPLSNASAKCLYAIFLNRLLFRLQPKLSLSCMVFCLSEGRTIAF